MSLNLKKGKIQIKNSLQYILKCTSDVKYTDGWQFNSIMHLNLKTYPDGFDGFIAQYCI